MSLATKVHVSLACARPVSFKKTDNVNTALLLLYNLQAVDPCLSLDRLTNSHAHFRMLSCTGFPRNSFC